MPRQDIPALRHAAWAGLVALPVYLAGTAPLVYWRDSAEFSMLGHNLDIGHPAGSPLFSLLSRALEFLPLGSIPFRATLVGVFSACLAVGLLAYLVHRVAERVGLTGIAAAIPAWVAVAAFAFAPAFYDWVVSPEVYAGQVLIMLAVIAVAMRLWERDEPPDRRWVFAAALLLGLGCGMHMGLILLAPGLTLLVVLHHRRLWNLRDIFLFIAFAAIGFTVFAYLPIRSATTPPFDHGNTEFYDAFLGHITGRTYSGIIHSYPWPRIAYNLRHLLGHFSHQLSWVGALLALIGLVAFLRQAPLMAVGLVLTVAGHLYLYVKDWYVAFGYIPLFALAAILAGFGAAALLSLDRRGGENRPRTLLYWTIVVAGMLFVQTHFVLTHHSRAENDRAHRHGRGLLDALPENALFVSYIDSQTYITTYMQSVERYREDVVHFHRALFHAQDELLARHPDLDLSDLNVDQPYGVQAWLLAHADRHAPFWDYGWEEGPYVQGDHLRPYGFVWRVLSPEAPTDWDQARLWNRHFAPVIRRPEDTPYDYTAIDVYSRRLSLMAKLDYERGDLDAAAEDLRTALAIRPDHGQFYGQLAVIESGRGNLEAAVRLAAQGVEEQPYLTQNWNYLATLALRADKPDVAGNAYQKSLALNRFQSEPAADYAALLMHSKEYAQAEHWARNALKGATTRKQTMRADAVLARALIGQGNCGAAVGILEKLVQDDPDDKSHAKLLAACRASGGTGGRP
ncbi:DUF2723 domain-containing protein [bacterium]|nr:DUF2723 domain-containing protein [bacterium]